MRRVALLTVVVLTAAGCGNSLVGTSGSISGTVGVSVAIARTTARLGPIAVSSRLRRTMPGDPSAVPDELLVKFRPGVSLQAAEIHRQAGAIEVRRLRKVDVTLVRITSGEPLAAVQAKYRSDPRVAYAEPNYYRYSDSTTVRVAEVTPNDPLFPLQWHYTSIGLPEAWSVTSGSALVVVAVIDKGIRVHPDLSGAIVPGFDFVDNDTDPAPTCSDPGDAGHGTHTAGIIAAITNNSAGVAGVNWGGSGSTKIMPLRIFGPANGSCVTTSARMIDAIEYAADHSARVISMSFGGPLIGTFSQAEQDAINYAHNLGVIVIASAGNDNGECSSRYPAAYANVVGVAATTIANTKASYSNFGGCIDLAAPGGELSSDVNGDGNPDGVLSTFDVSGPAQYAFRDGTSAAAPHVAGLAALLISKGVTGPEAIRSIMQSTAVDLGIPGLGAGLINAAAALGAPATLHPVRAFAGTLSGTTISVVSSMVTVAPTGAYSVPTVPPGTWTVFAWQDTNGNGQVDAGDLYGTAPGILVTSGAVTGGVNVAITEVPLGNPPITLTGAAVAR